MVFLFHTSKPLKEIRLYHGKAWCYPVINYAKETEEKKQLVHTMFKIILCQCLRGLIANKKGIS